MNDIGCIMIFKKGDTVYEYDEYTYGCISFNGIACTMKPGELPFFELPKEALDE